MTNNVTQEMYFDFDLSQYEPQTSIYSAVPKGKYVCQIENAVISLSRNGGRYVSLKFRIVEGKNKNRVIKENLNIFLPAHPEVQEKARSMLHGIAKILGISEELNQIKNVSILRNQIIGVEIDICKEGKNEGKNIVRGYMDKNSVFPATGEPMASNDINDEIPWL